MFIFLINIHYSSLALEKKENLVSGRINTDPLDFALIKQKLTLVNMYSFLTWKSPFLYRSHIYLRHKYTCTWKKSQTAYIIRFKWPIIFFFMFILLKNITEAKKKVIYILFQIFYKINIKIIVIYIYNKGFWVFWYLHKEKSDK